MMPGCFPSQQIAVTFSSMESPYDTTTMLEQLELEIARWSRVLSSMNANDKKRRIIEAKLADWKQKREQLASIYIAELKHKRESRRVR
jgi:hypothetical protein